MFKKLASLFRVITRSKSQLHGIKGNSPAEGEDAVPRDIRVVRQRLEQAFKGGSDFVLREVTLGSHQGTKVIVAYIDGLANKVIISSDILKPLMLESSMAKIEVGDDPWFAITNYVLTMSELKKANTWQDTVEAILSGDTAIYLAGCDVALVAGTKGWETRGIEEPETEAVVRGPREGFVESIRSNTSLIRRKLKNTSLQLEMITLGTHTKTQVCICYLEGVADKNTVDLVKDRLSQIKTDAILESGYIEQYIEDSHWSLFPTVGHTEKPDNVVSKLLEGRVAILCDGTPFALTVPYVFIESLQTSEDFYTRPLYGSFTRVLRGVALFTSAVLPAVYVAAISFHATTIPFTLLLTIASAREGVPFSPFFEAVGMGFTFELLREAGVRMPRPIGQAVSIVGALVIGEAAVNAGLTSNIMVMIVAFTGVTSFIVPTMREPLPFIRILLLVLGNIIGFLGILIGLLVISLHLAGLSSFGVPYLAPLAPFYVRNMSDTILRLPLWLIDNNPILFRRGRYLRKK